MDGKKTKVNNNFTKLTHKGVSLIVLIVTIIVIVILAATVILVVSKNNPIESAREARFKEDVRMFQDELNMVIAKEYTSLQGQRDKKITALEYTEKGDKNSVYTYLSNFTKKYENKIGIKEDEIIYVGLDEKEREWLINSGIYMAKKITVHYKDGYGNSIKESEEYPMLDVKYHFEAPEIEGYMALNEIEEGITSGDREITFEYCMISNDLAFIGLDSSGNETNVESDIAAYTVSGIGECNNPYVAIPREYNGKAVTKIKNKAFISNKVINKLVINNNIESIGAEAFRYSNLKELKVDSKVIGDWAFVGTQLESVEIGKNVNSIASYGFASNPKLKKLLMTSENISVSFATFSGCNLLTEIKVNEDNNGYKVEDGVMYSKDGTKIVIYPTAKEGEYIIPNGVTSIERCAFSSNQKLEKLEIPTSVVNIGAEAFRYSNLKELKVDSKVIGDRAFVGTQLESVEIGKNVNSIASYGFASNPKLKKLLMTSENISVSFATFSGCNLLTEIKVNEDNNGYKVEDGVMYSKDGTKIVIYPTAKEGEYIIPNGVTSIERYAFCSNQKLEKLEIPTSVVNIGLGAFRNSNLKELKVDSKVIADWAFAGTQLESVEIGKNVNSIGMYGFASNPKLKNMIYLGTMEQWNNVIKAKYWNSGISINVVNCSDGEITF